MLLLGTVIFSSSWFPIPPGDKPRLDEENTGWNSRNTGNDTRRETRENDPGVRFTRDKTEERDGRRGDIGASFNSDYRTIELTGSTKLTNR